MVFVVRRRDGTLSIAAWGIHATGDVTSSHARFSMRVLAKVALLAADDAIATDSIPTDIPGMFTTAEYRIVGGRVDDPRAYQPRRTPRPSNDRDDNGDGTVHRAAAAYRQAVEQSSRSPTADAARALCVSRATAGRAISEARKLGLLGAALRTQPGEQT